MIRFEATLLILLCLSGSLVIGSIAAWAIGSFLVGVVVTGGLFCFLLDLMFSYEEMEDEDYDDDF